MNQNGACGAGHSGAANFLFADGEEEVVARVKVVKSVRGRYAEDEVCSSDGQDWSSPVEASHIFHDWAIAAFGDPHRAKSGHLLQAGS